ncbi:MAG: D-alanine--D-alanine ligase [Planctomycetes bacterium]|nr:D-alanine--D-alanine ligase [Planctomycetota bacterium]
MRVVVLHNAEEALASGAAQDALAVVSVQACARAIAAALEAQGHHVETLAAPEQPAALLAALERARPDALFNLVESYRGEAALEPAVGALLELSGVPFTGNRSLACALALRKPVAKALLAAAGVPVAEGVVVGGDAALDAAADEAALAALARRVAFPWIVKPAREDASHGIGAASVVDDVAAAHARARVVVATYRQPALVERFIAGRELNVALIGPAAAPQLLPIAEIDFAKFPAGRRRLVTYESKWVEGSPDWNGTNVVDATLAPAVARRVEEVARAAWRTLEFSGYGRIDLRLDAHDEPVVLEANPNPDLSPDAGFARAWGRTGASYEQLVARLLALARPGPVA